MTKETDELNARIERLEAIAGLKRTPIRKPGKRAEKQTVEDRAKSKLLEYLPESELVEFEKAAAELDALRVALHATKDKDTARDLAYQVVVDTSALFALEIPLLEKVQAEVLVLWEGTQEQLRASNALKDAEQARHKDVMDIGYTMPPKNPKQSPEERQAELAPIVGPYSEKRRKSRATLMETMKKINADTKDLRKQDKELKFELGRFKSMIGGLKSIPDNRYPLPPPKRSPLHHIDKPVTIPDMSPAERMHASGTHYAENFVKAMK